MRAILDNVQFHGTRHRNGRSFGMIRRDHTIQSATNNLSRALDPVRDVGETHPPRNLCRRMFI